MLGAIQLFINNDPQKTCLRFSLDIDIFILISILSKFLSRRESKLPDAFSRIKITFTVEVVIFLILEIHVIILYVMWYQVQGTGKSANIKV